ncbi:MAG TPA: YceI family protein [Candidatus Paceibacterota bacterium]|nr:YceI family protein [Candidatus Paceibacterota bacterium]
MKLFAKSVAALVLVLTICLAGFFAYVSRPKTESSGDIARVAAVLRPLSDVTSLYRISSNDSSAEFRIGHIVGSTNEIGGDIALTDSYLDLSSTTIDARSLSTGNRLADNLMANFSLRTNQPENAFIVFTPKYIGSPGTIALGKPISFDLPGTLAIAGVSKPVIFHATLLKRKDFIIVTATSSMERSDFGIWAPGLSDTVGLSVSLEAKKIN